MPSPFPGVDPYLEDSAWWVGFHNTFVSQVAGVLNRILPAGLLANSKARFVALPTLKDFVADVAVKEPSREQTYRPQGGTAVLERASPHGTLIAYPLEIREMFIEIRAVKDFEQVITVIELLSPTNKTPGDGRDQYLTKQRTLLKSQTHLLEIDLLRGGKHTVATPEEDLRQIGRWDHLITLHRATQRYHYEYWFNTLCEPLPTVAVPLTEEFADIELDLQAVYDQTYDLGPYARGVDYRQEPPVLLSQEAAVWADTLLRAKGLRP